MPRAVHVISTPSGVGGAERIVASLVHAAPGHGWEELVLNPFAESGEPALRSLFPAGSYESFPVGSVLELPRARRWLRGRLDVLQPDIVHAHLFHASVLTAFTPRRPGTIYIATHHHGDVLVWRERRIRTRLDRYAAKRFDRVVAVSDGVGEFLIKTYGCSPDRVSVIRNGWEGHPQPRKTPEVPTVLNVGNLRPEKGHELLLEAFARVRKTIPQARLVIVGDGPLRVHLERSAGALGIGGSVQFAGSRPDVWPFLSEASVFALPSYSEPLGLVVLEAMAAGLPVVATDVGGVPELVTPGLTGTLVSSGDTDGFAAALQNSLQRPAEAEKMGEEGRRRAEGLRAENMIASYFGLYESLLSPNKI